MKAAYSNLAKPATWPTPAGIEAISPQPRGRDNARRGGVTFLPSTSDAYIRAYYIGTGRQPWQDRLPAGAQSTGMTYAFDERLYVVTAT